MGVSKNIPANERSMAGFALVPLLTAGLAISLREKNAGYAVSRYLLNKLWFYISSHAFIRVYLRLIKRYPSEINRGWTQINADNHTILSMYVLSAGGVVTTHESPSTAEGKSKETRGEPVDLKDIMMIGQLTIEEGVALNAKVPNDRLISREGKCIPQYRHRRLIGADIYTESDSRSNIYHRRYVSQNRYETVVDGWRRSGRGIESGSGLSDRGNITALIDRSN